MATDHDSSYKFLFSTPELVRDLIIGFVPDEWLHSLDYSTLEKVPGSYVTEDFRHRADDIVWRVKVGGEWVYLYLLIEFQSSVDKYMALRMMVYQGLLYQDLIKRGEVLADGRLPPILPIVLYNGSQRWTSPTDVFDLIPPTPGLVAQFKPKAKYLLIDENAYSDSELASIKNLVAAVFVQGAVEQAEQAGFASAVAADEGSVLAGVDGDGGVVEQDLGAALEGDVLQDDHGAGVSFRASRVSRSTWRSPALVSSHTGLRCGNAVSK